MDNRQLVKGIIDVEQVIARHEVTQMFGDETTLATVIKGNGEEASHIIKSKDNKPKIRDREIAILLATHYCGDNCYADPKYFTKVVQTSGSPDAGPDDILPEFIRTHYKRKEPEQPFNPEELVFNY